MTRILRSVHHRNDEVVTSGCLVFVCSLRSTVSPQQERARRTDNSVDVWLQEAKHLPSRRSYFCELCLDGTIYARSSKKPVRSEQKTDTLFWGEQFEFLNLPDVEALTINVYKEPEKKKRKEKNSMIGQY